MLWLNRFTRLVTAAAFLLIAAGALVASTGSGLSIPDWPTSMGSPILAFPYSQWVGGVLYAQAHRLLGVIVGLLTILMVFAYWQLDPRAWARRLALGALAALLAQALLGGFDVLHGLPATASSAHAGLSVLFLAIAASLVVFTSSGWQTAYPADREAARSADALAADRRLRRLSVLAIAVVYLEILLGAVMRHTGAGLAIPDYPLMFGRLLPPAGRMSAAVAVNMAHRLAAIVVAVVLVMTWWRVLRHHRDRGELTRPASAMVLLLAVQVALGGLAVIFAQNVLIDTVQVLSGAVLLVAAVILALRVHRPFFAGGAGAPARPDTGARRRPTAAARGAE
jgi:cytochrome c oxidase assembly protein subunit 15